MSELNIYHESNSTFIANFWDHDRTKNEQRKTVELSNLVLAFYQKVFDVYEDNSSYIHFPYDFLDYGYLENYGYYVVRDGNWHYYTVTCHGEDISEAVIDMAKSIINAKASSKLNKDRQEIKNNIKKQFNSTEKYEDIFRTEYALKIWDTYFEGKTPEELVKYYEFILNNYQENSIFKYDSEKKELIKTQIKKRKLRR